MPAPTPGRRRAPVTVTATAAAAVLGLLTGCSNARHGTPAPAPKSTAAGAGVVARIPVGTPLAAAVTTAPATTGPLTLSSASDGSLLLAVPGRVARLGPRGALTQATGAGVSAPSGVVGLPDGSFVTGSGDRLVRVTPGGPASPIAGAAGAPRPLTAPVPAGGPAGSVHLTQDVTPVGSAADGTLILADGDVVWRMRIGKLTAAYHGDVHDDVLALTPGGTLYLVPRGSGATLAGTRVVSPAGHASALALPSSVAGVPGDPGTLTPVSVTGDGKDGVFVHARRGPAGHPTGDWVLHVRAGTAQVVLASTAPAATTCALKGRTDPAHFPCALPLALTSQPGLLVLAGGTGYVVGVS